MQRSVRMSSVFGLTDSTDAVMATAWMCGKQGGGETMQRCGSRLLQELRNSSGAKLWYLVAAGRMRK